MQLRPVTAPLALAPSPTATESLLTERMNAPATFADIQALSVEPRVWKTPGHAKAVDYVLAQLHAAGWEAHVEELQSSGGWGGSGLLRNVVATRKGTAPDADRKLVVAGAHLDTVRGAPGANDDGSGSATLINLAKAFNGVDTRNDLELIWFDGEEEGLLGSTAHVKANPQDTARTVEMINMDMIASPNGTMGFDLGKHTTNGASDALRGVLERNGMQATEWPDRHSRSDHASFDSAGIPAIDFGISVRDVEGQDPNYHSPRDTADKINMNVLEGYGDMIAVTLLDAANRAARP